MRRVLRRLAALTTVTTFGLLLGSAQASLPDAPAAPVVVSKLPSGSDAYWQVSDDGSVVAVGS